MIVSTRFSVLILLCLITANISSSHAHGGEETGSPEETKISLSLEVILFLTLLSGVLLLSLLSSYVGIDDKRFLIKLGLLTLVLLILDYTYIKFLR